MDIAAAERLTSVADPKGLSALKQQSSDPAAAKAVAGQFGALLMQGVMHGSDGSVMSMAGDGVGANIVSGLFASTVSQAAMAGDKLGLADMLFRSIDAKQHVAGTTGDEQQSLSFAPQNSSPATLPSSQGAASGGLPLDAYWQGNGIRPPGFKPVRASPGSAGVAAAGRAGFVAASGSVPPTYGWAPTQLITNDYTYASQASAQVTSFTQQLGPLLQEAGRQLGVSPKILLAQAALETGWGRSVVGNNVFGIKAGPSWQGPEVTTMTHEAEAGQMVVREASFRSYPSLDAAVKDYVALIGSSARYHSVIGAGDNVAAYARGLAAGGYATDNEYAGKLEAIAAGPSVGAAFGAQSQPGPLRLFGSEG